MKNRGIFSIFSRYLFLEALYPFAYGTLGLLVFLVSTLLYEMADLLIIRDISLLVVVEILLYRMPLLLVIAFPIAVLFATIFSLSRLIKDNELDAIRMSGFGLYKIYIPFIILGLIVSLSTFWVNEKVASWANSQLTLVLSRVIQIGSEPMYKDDIFFKGSEGRLFFVNKADRANQSLYDILIYEPEIKGVERRVITASKGTYNENTWTLEQGIINYFNAEGFIYKKSTFEVMEIEMEKGYENLFGSPKEPDQMTRSELSEEINILNKRGIPAHRLKVQYHLKLAQPFASLIFILVGVPLSLRNRKGRIFGLLLALLVTLGYYIMLSLGQSLGNSAILPPLFAAWLANLFFAAVGFGLVMWEERYGN